MAARHRRPAGGERALPRTRSAGALAQLSAAAAVQRVHIDKLVVVGVGLIGGSFALALQRGRARSATSSASAARAANLDAALARGIVDRARARSTTTGRRELADADLVLRRGAGRRSIAALLRGDRAARSAPHAIVTDAGSTKQDVIAAARAALGDALPRFVPGHPIAGTEHTRRGGRVRDAVRGRNVVLTPLAETDPRRASRASRDCGEPAARACRALDAGAHDRDLRRGVAPAALLAFALVDELARAPRRRRAASRIAGERLSRFHAHRRELARDVARHRARQPRCAAAPRSIAYRAQLDRDRALIAAGDGAALEARVRARAPRARALGARRAQRRRPTAPRRRAARGRDDAAAAAALDARAGRARAAGTVALPGSKSISNRTLLLAALAQRRRRTLARPARRRRHRPDARGAARARRRASSATPATRDVVVDGTGGAFPVERARAVPRQRRHGVPPADRGACVRRRRLRAVAACARMHERPIGDLVDALRALGARHRLPRRRRLSAARDRHRRRRAPADACRVRGDVSSQFLSALLMALPLRARRARRAIDRRRRRRR